MRDPTGNEPPLPGDDDVELSILVSGHGLHICNVAQACHTRITYVSPFPILVTTICLHFILAETRHKNRKGVAPEAGPGLCCVKNQQPRILQSFCMGSTLTLVPSSVYGAVHACTFRYGCLSDVNFCVQFGQWCALQALDVRTGEVFSATVTWPDEMTVRNLQQQLSLAAEAASLGLRRSPALAHAVEHMLVQVVVPRALAKASKRRGGSAMLLQLKSDWHSVDMKVASKMEMVDC